MKRAIIECGVVETRAALLIDDVVWKFWFGPARGDETVDAFPRAGRRFAGRLKRIDRGLGAAFVDLGDGRDAFLPIKKTIEAHCVEGALLEIDVKSPPRQGKGAALRFLNVLEAGAPGRLPPFADAVVEAAEAIAKEADEIVINDGPAKKALEDAGFGNVFHDSRPVSLFSAHGADTELDAEFLRCVPLAGGGRLVIDETQGLTSIDVDTGAFSASSPARLRERIACLAADEAVRQVSLRKIGGHVVIDFPDISNDAGRKRFNDHLKKAMKRLDGAGAASFSKSGLFSFTMPHRELSLLDRFTETGSDDPVSGRRFSLDYLAKKAVSALERALREKPSARYQLTLSEALNTYLETHGQWAARLSERYGARFTVAASTELEERDFDLGEQ